MSDVEKLAKTVIELRVAGMKPRDLIEIVRAKHPKASKKDISRAAFYAVILMAESDPSEAAHVQDFALSARGDEEAPLPAAPRRARTKRTGEGPLQGA